MNWGAGGTRTFRPLQGAEVNYLGPPSWVDPDWSPGSPTWVPAGSPLHRKAPEGPVPAPLREAEGAQETAAGAPCGPRALSGRCTQDLGALQTGMLLL